MSSWQVQDAKARFSEFLDATIKKGPQVVTRGGIETAVPTDGFSTRSRTFSYPRWSELCANSVSDVWNFNSDAIPAKTHSRTVIHNQIRRHALSSTQCGRSLPHLAATSSQTRNPRRVSISC
jgi:hypothetical protein